MVKKIYNSVLVFLLVFSFMIIAKELGTHKIDPVACTACAICVDICPEGSISEAVVEGKNVYVIDPETCTDCGACVEVCPEEAISAGDE